VAVIRLPAKPKPDRAEAFFAWLEKSFVFPSGPARGKPFALLPFQRDFVRDVLERDGPDPKYRTGILSVARKNGKSALLAALLLGFMLADSPVHIPGCKAGIVAPTARHATLVFQQAMEILEASDRKGDAKIWQHPAPGYFKCGSARCDIFSGSKTSGHGSSLSVAIADEVGLLPARNAGLIDNFLDALTIENGQLLLLGTRGDSDAFNDLIDNPPPRTAVHVYSADRQDDPGDPETWRKSNPGLGAVKSIRAMDDLHAKAVSAGTIKEFMAWNLNVRLSPSRELLIDYPVLSACYRDDAGPVEGEACFIGLDLGGSTSQTAAVIAYESGFVRHLSAFASDGLTLGERGQRDNVGDVYERGHAAGDLILTSGRVTDIPEFLSALVERIGPHPAASVSCDRYRQAELLTALQRAGLPWKPRWRGQGPKDGDQDIRAARRLFLAEAITMQRSQLFEAAIGETDVRTSFTGACQLDRSHRSARIDLTQATVLALSALMEAREYVPPEYQVEVI
jgi:phage terminase large subunit-like protein